MIKVNKILGGAALATVLALSLDASSHVRTGPYVGLNVGYANLNPNAKVRDDANAADIGNGLKLNQHKGMFQTNLFAGYEWLLQNNLVLGTELTFGGSFSGTKKGYDASLPAFAGDIRCYKIRQQWKTGLYGLVGTSLTERVSLYGKLGILYGRFQSDHGNDVAVTGAPSSTIKKNTNLFGVEPGIRMKVALSESWAATFDASYAFYQNKKQTIFTTNAGQVQALKKFAPRVWGITAGLAYKF